MAVNISTTLALVTRHMLMEKQAVKSAMTTKRIASDPTKYKTTMEAIGSKEARKTPRTEAKRLTAFSEYMTVFAVQSDGFGFCIDDQRRE